MTKYLRKIKTGDEDRRGEERRGEKPQALEN